MKSLAVKVEWGIPRSEAPTRSRSFLASMSSARALATPAERVKASVSRCGRSYAMVWAKHQPDAGVALHPP